MLVGAATGGSTVTDVDDPVVNTSGVPPPTGVAVILKRGFVAGFAGAATAWTMNAFDSARTVAIVGSSASTVNVAGTIVPPLETRAVRNICAWKPGGMLVDE